MQPTRATRQKECPAHYRRAAPIRFCSRWGLPCRCCYQQRGALLPHPFALTTPRREWSAFCCTVPKAKIALRLAGCYPAPILAGARTFLSIPVTRYRATIQPPDYVTISEPSPYVSKSCHSKARHSPSITPSIFSGRKRRWKAITALSATSTA